jgi:hypothetical protein
MPVMCLIILFGQGGVPIVNAVLVCVFGNDLNLCEQTGKNNINFL